VTDIMLEAMDADVALLNAGTLRSDTVHPVGSFKLKDLMAILPMIDLITVLKISGKKHSLFVGLYENNVSSYRLSFDDVMNYVCLSNLSMLCYINVLKIIKSV